MRAANAFSPLVSWVKSLHRQSQQVALVEFRLKPVPSLHKMRSLVSDDGRIAQFFLLFKGGQNAGFSIPFHKIGLFITAIKNVAKTA